MKRSGIAALLMLALAACAHVPVTSPEQALERVSWRRAGITADDLSFGGLAEAARRSLEYYRKLPADAPLIFGPERVTANDLIVTVQNLLLIVENASLSDQQKWEEIKDRFILFRAEGSDGNGRTLFTGYYEPTLSCRTSRDSFFKYPLYKRPSDIIEVDLTLFGNGFPKNKLFGRLENRKVVPYFSREEIDSKRALAKKDLEVLWCADIVDVYFLQVQGSGKADLGNGSLVSVLYDGQYGRPYRCLGKYLIDAVAIAREEMSMQAIRQFLRDNPGAVPDVLSQNPSYVFFRLDTGPSLGSLGVPVTPFRSVAMDAALFPKGAVALIKTEKPVIAEDGSITEWVPFSRFAFNQDTGGAIRGAGRVDLFMGQGREAEITAGYMQQEGELYFLLRKP
jgi:membrane-bound lytic murein transglycosylase A